MITIYFSLYSRFEFGKNANSNYVSNISFTDGKITQVSYTETFTYSNTATMEEKIRVEFSYDEVEIVLPVVTEWHKMVKATEFHNSSLLIFQNYIDLNCRM